MGLIRDSKDNEQLVYDIDTRLESLQKENRQLLFFMAQFSAQLLAALVVMAWSREAGSIVAVPALINSLSIMWKMRKWVKI
jgi:hypothetical protein